MRIYILTTEVLGKGFNFSPDSNLNLFQRILGINRFARFMTAKWHFFSDDIGGDRSNLNKMDTPIVNEFGKLLFKEQMSVIALQDLSDSQGVIKDETVPGIKLLHFPYFTYEILDSLL